MKGWDKEGWSRAPGSASSVHVTHTIPQKGPTPVLMFCYQHHPFLGEHMFELVFCRFSGSMDCVCEQRRLSNKLVLYALRSTHMQLLAMPHEHRTQWILYYAWESSKTKSEYKVSMLLLQLGKQDMDSHERPHFAFETELALNSEKGNDVLRNTDNKGTYDIFSCLCLLYNQLFMLKKKIIQKDRDER